MRYRDDLRALQLSDDQKSLVIGAVYGDSTIAKKSFRSPNGFMVLAHGSDQIEYLKWKLDFMKPFYPAYERLGLYKAVDKRTGSITYRRDSVSHSFFGDIYTKFYVRKNDKNIKIVTKETLDMLTPLGLAIWYMDDGYLHNKWEADICTDCFRYDEVEMIRDFLISKYQINSVHLVKKPDNNKIYWRIRFRVSEILSHIEQFMHPTMMYKLVTQESSETNTLNTLKKR